MITLGQKQRLFVRLQTEWLAWAHEQGYEFTTGDGHRNKKAFGKMGEKGPYGHRNSCHKLKLAHDWNLFINGVYQTTTEAHRPLGEKWESMHELCRWGGRFRRPDGNHYSITHGGFL